MNKVISFSERPAPPGPGSQEGWSVSPISTPICRPSRAQLPPPNEVDAPGLSLWLGCVVPANDLPAGVLSLLDVHWSGGARLCLRVEKEGRGLRERRDRDRLRGKTLSRAHPQGHFGSLKPNFSLDTDDLSDTCAPTVFIVSRLLRVWRTWAPSPVSIPLHPHHPSQPQRPTQLILSIFAADAIEGSVEAKTVGNTHSHRALFTPGKRRGTRSGRPCRSTFGKPCIHTNQFEHVSDPGARVGKAFGKRGGGGGENVRSEGVELVLESVGVLGIEEDLSDLRSVSVDSSPLAGDLGREDEVSEDALVNSGEGSRSGSLLLVSGVLGGRGEHTSLGEEDEVSVELLLELSGEPDRRVKQKGWASSQSRRSIGVRALRAWSPPSSSRLRPVHYAPPLASQSVHALTPHPSRPYPIPLSSSSLA